MGILIDGVIVAIFILNIFIGYKKGLINVIFNILAFFIAIIITIILYKPVSNIIIEKTDIKENIKTMILQNKNKEENAQEENENPNDIQIYIKNAIGDVEEEAKKTATETIAETIATKAIEILTCVVLFILTRIVLVILKFFTETLANLPLVKQLNEIGGIAYGIATGIIIVYIILTIMYIVISIKGNGEIAKAIEESYIAKFLYNNNIIINYCLLGKNLL